MLFILSIGWTHLDIEKKLVEIRWKLSEIHSSQVEHSKFYKPNFVDFEVFKS